MEAYIRKMVQQDWFLGVAAAVLISVGVCGIVASFAFGSLPSDDAPTDQVRQAKATLARDIAEKKAVAAETRIAPEVKVQETIDRHLEKVKAYPKGPNTAAYLAAAGNLYYGKLKDYEKAIECYERLLVDFPDWVNTDQILSSLAECYEAVGKHEDARWAYKQILSKYPEGTPAYEDAQQKLREQSAI